MGRSCGSHRVAYVLAVGPIPDGLYVCHRCDVKACCNPKHLFLGTNSDNQNDLWMKGLGRARSGPDHHFAKLTPEQVSEIRVRLSAGETQKSIAQAFGISRTHVGSLKTGHRWSRGVEK